jgi:O-acetyl-ADP-ribose deacetylase (regulator of RNase III)
MDAVVNAANAELAPGGGVAGAIHKAAGPKLHEECKSLAPIEAGQAVITDAYKLPNRRVIHCLGQVYGSDTPADKLLADCYRNALRLAEKEQLKSVAFPALSTGAFGYPMDEAAEVAFKTLIEEADGLKSVKTLRFVLASNRDRDLHAEILDRLLD